MATTANPASHPSVGVGYLACAAVNDALGAVPAGSVPLAIFSPRYLDLIDYAAAAQGHDRAAWRSGPRETLGDYLTEHRQTVGLLAEAMTPDATICIEIDEVRDTPSKSLVGLSDAWRALVQAAGFRIVEHIRLTRAIALGHRSGHFVRSAGQPGMFLPDNVCSTLIVAQRGDPMARLRHASRHEPSWHTPVDWAQPFLTNHWKIAAPPRARRRFVPENHGALMHPVPMDSRVAEACVRFYSLPNDHVLAPYSGSGTVASVAAPLGRIPICIEREPNFVALIRARVPLAWRPLTAVTRPLMRTGAQLALPLSDAVVAMARQHYLDRGSRVDVTARHRAIAQFATKAAGVVITPEMLAACMIAERQYCDRRAAQRTG